MMHIFKKQIILISIVSTFSLILTGCGGIPVHAEPETGLPCYSDMQELIGHTAIDVSDRLGQPDYQFSTSENEYFIYEGRGVVDIVWDVFIPFIVLPGEIYDDPEVFYCVLIEFDKNSRVIRHDSDWEWSQIPSTCAPLLFNDEARTKITRYLQGQARDGDTDVVFALAKFFEAPVHEYKDDLIRKALAGDVDSAYTLATVFYEDVFLKKLALEDQLAKEKLTKFILSEYGYDLNTLQEKSRQGDEDAKWKLYDLLPTKESFVWLCKEADQGNRGARNELGSLYLHGSDQYREIIDTHVPADISRACMWFHLSGMAKIAEFANIEKLEYAPDPHTSNEVQRTASVMTNKELDEAEKLIQDWGVDQCSKDIGRYSSTQINELIVLCEAADQGDYSARDKLGWIYFMGSHGVEADRRHAYMWYYLAATVYSPPKMTGMQERCDSMTHQERAISLKLLKEWKPGKCEQDLLQK